MAKKGQQESQKNKNAKQQKAATDKTFGLKNKNKSSKIQQYVAQIESQTANSAAAKRKEAENARKAAERKAAEAAKAEARALFSHAMMPQQKVTAGVDPKSVVCAFFKQGLCNKGARCKFSHDLSVERKGPKRDLYSDERGDTKEDKMDQWDEEKLRKVVLSKHGNPKTTTDKICKHFIEAVENGLYGWFWMCPNNGDNCKYRHSLPPGFVLKTKEEQRMERQALANAPKITLEEFLDTERAKLPKSKTPITLETFTAWKKKRDLEKAKAAEVAAKNKKTPLSGRQLMMSGKYPSTQEDDEDDIWDLSEMRRQTEEKKDRADLELERAAEQSAEQARQKQGSTPIAV